MYKSYSELGVKPEQNTDQYSVLELKTLEERIELIKSNRVVCIDIYADWCGPCIQTAPAYSVVANKYNKPGTCSIVKLNWDKVDVDERNSINGIPVFLLYLDGNIVDRVVGADIGLVENKITELLKQVSSNIENVRGPQHLRSNIRSNKQQTTMPSFDDNSYNQSQYRQPEQYQQYSQGQPQQRPQGMPQGMPQGIPQGQPQQRPQGVPQGQNNQGIPQGMHHGQPQQRPYGIPQGMPQAHQGQPQDPFRQQNVQYYK